MSKPRPAFAFIGTWGSSGAADGHFNRPLDVDVAQDGSVYIVDTNNSRIQRFTADGGFLGKWGSQFSMPSDVVVGPDASVYVADTNNNRIQQFTADGRYLRQWGRRGTGDGQFDRPCSIAVAADGRVYVADTVNRRIQQFTADGSFIGKWAAGDFFSGPRGVAAALDGSIYVTPSGGLGDSRVDRFAADGAHYPIPDGRIPGGPEVDVAPDGSVYVPVGDEIQRFTPGGRFLEKWGSYGSGDGQFVNPVGVTAAADGTIYVVDTDNDRIQRFSGPATGLLRLCVRDSGFIDMGEHTFTLDPAPVSTSASREAGPNVTTPASRPSSEVSVPTGGCVTLEVSADTTLTITEQLPPNLNWKVETTTVTPVAERRSCAKPAPNAVCAYVNRGAVIEVMFSNRRLGVPSEL